MQELYKKPQTLKFKKFNLKSKIDHLRVKGKFIYTSLLFRFSANSCLPPPPPPICSRGGFAKIFSRKPFMGSRVREFALSLSNAHCGIGAAANSRVQELLLVGREVFCLFSESFIYNPLLLNRTAFGRGFFEPGTIFFPLEPRLFFFLGLPPSSSSWWLLRLLIDTFSAFFWWGGWGRGRKSGGDAKSVIQPKGGGIWGLKLCGKYWLMDCERLECRRVANADNWML